MNLKASNKQPKHDFVNSSTFLKKSLNLEFYKSISSQFFAHILKGPYRSHLKPESLSRPYQKEIPSDFWPKNGCQIAQNLNFWKKSRQEPPLVTIEHYKHGCTCFQKKFRRAEGRTNARTHARTYSVPSDKVRFKT